MKRFEEPVLDIEKFDILDVITSSDVLPEDEF